MADLSFLPDKIKPKNDLSFLPDKKADLSFLPDKQPTTVSNLGQPKLPTEPPKLEWTQPGSNELPGTPGYEVLNKRNQDIREQKREQNLSSRLQDAFNKLPKLGNVIQPPETVVSAMIIARKTGDTSILDKAWDKVAQGFGISDIPNAGKILKEHQDSESKKTMLDVATGSSLAAPLKLTGTKALEVLTREPVNLIKPAIQKELSPLDDAINTVRQQLKPAKLSRAEQEHMYSIEKGQRIKEMESIPNDVQGRARFKEELGKLKGEYTKVTYEPIKIPEEKITMLFNHIDTMQIDKFSKINTKKGLLKLFGESGGRVPTESEQILLKRAFGEGLVDDLMKARPKLEKMKEIGIEIVNLPRAVMSSFDMSFPLRQGIWFAGRKEFLPAAKDMVKAFGSEKAYKGIQESVYSNPLFGFADEAGLSLTDIGAGVGGREEKFIGGRLAEFIPGVRRSSRAYTAMANKLRMDVFTDMVDNATKLASKPGISEAQKIALNPRTNPTLAKDIAKYINSATGRGDLPNFAKNAAPVFNALFFSPKLAASRLDLLSKPFRPSFYTTLSPFVRKEYLKDMARYTALQISIASLAKLAGADIGLNPLSTDFLKVKIGNTRFDPYGGFQQYIVLGARELAGKVVSSTTGKEVTLGEKYASPTRLDILQRAVEYKEAPVISLVTRLLKGKDATGKPLNITNEVAQRFYPMFISDLYDLAKDDPKLLPLGLLGGLGVGVQTYKPTKTTQIKVYK